MSQQPPRALMWALIVWLVVVAAGVAGAATAVVLRLAGVHGGPAIAGMCIGTCGGTVLLVWTLAPTLVGWVFRQLGMNGDRPAE